VSNQTEAMKPLWVRKLEVLATAAFPEAPVPIKVWVATGEYVMRHASLDAFELRLMCGSFDVMVLSAPSLDRCVFLAEQALLTLIADRDSADKTP
jgi:hypothetical protein